MAAGKLANLLYVLRVVDAVASWVVDTVAPSASFADGIPYMLHDASWPCWLWFSPWFWHWVWAVEM